MADKKKSKKPVKKLTKKQMDALKGGGDLGRVDFPPPDDMRCTCMATAGTVDGPCCQTPNSKCGNERTDCPGQGNSGR